MWSKGLFQGTNVHKITDHCRIDRNGTEYIVGFIENNSYIPGDSDNMSAGLIFLMDKNGNVTVSKSTENIENSSGQTVNLHIKRIQPGHPGTGDFLFCGSDVNGTYRTAMWGYGNVFTSDLIHYADVKSPSTSNVSDNGVTNFTKRRTSI